MKVIGYEGGHPGDNPISWGCAAILGPDGVVYNACTGLGHRLDANNPVEEHIAFLPEPIYVDGIGTDAGAVVLDVTDFANALLGIYRLVPKSTRNASAGNRSFYVFATREDWRSFQVVLAEDVIRRSFKHEPSTALLRMATTVTAHNGRLNAVECFYTGREPEHGRARSSTLGQHEAFDAMWEQLQATVDA